MLHYQMHANTKCHWTERGGQRTFFRVNEICTDIEQIHKQNNALTRDIESSDFVIARYFPNI